MKKIIVFAINIYQKYVSKFLPPLCRYSPTCSEYARLAIIKYGLFSGGWKAMKRIGKCNPLFPGGIDRV